jgi:hypothetical protein
MIQFGTLDGLVFSKQIESGSLRFSIFWNDFPVSM